jgi:hypothetical protein
MTDWTREDSAWLRNLLSQPSGNKLVAEMRGLIPKVKTLTKESAWISAVEKQGAENFLEAFLRLADLPAPDSKDQPEYIDLTKEGD